MGISRSEGAKKERSMDISGGEGAKKEGSIGIARSDGVTEEHIPTYSRFLGVIFFSKYKLYLCLSSLLTLMKTNKMILEI